MTSDRRAYAVFHMNLMYSAVDEDRRSDVVDRAYRPLLELARDHGPVGVEATAETLVEVDRIDPTWLPALRELIAGGAVEFVGSGHAQVIGPMVPAVVNEHNLRLGQQSYEELLGARPTLAYVNEQAFSASIVAHYVAAGYEALFMEWNNPAHLHPEWELATRLSPQLVVGAGEVALPIVWNDTVAFQTLQAYSHGDIGFDEYLATMTFDSTPDAAAVCIYGSDAEVFDFRPRRYATESTLQAGIEWKRVAEVLDAVSARPGWSLVRPSGVLDMVGHHGAGVPLNLGSAAEPVVVKKQPKYNVTRWTITGRDDLGVNGTCWRISDALHAGGAGADDWRELCSLFGSDFRTHVSTDRWDRFRSRLDGLATTWHADQLAPAIDRAGALSDPGSDVAVHRSGKWLTVGTDHASVRLNLRRGMSIDGLWFGDPSGAPLCGTLARGYFHDIYMAADFYTGLTTVEIPGVRRIADLQSAEPEVAIDDSGDVVVDAVIDTQLGPVRKRLVLSVSEPRVELAYEFEWEDLPPSSIRVGAVTLVPGGMDRETLYYRTHLGGTKPETFRLAGADVDHGRSVSSLVSATSALGATEGWVELGDRSRGVRVAVDRGVCMPVALLTYREVAPSFFCRLAWSLGEFDETVSATRPSPHGLRLAITPAGPAT